MATTRAWRRPFSLRDLDTINRRAGQDFDACGPSRAALEEALDLSHARVHQIAHGDPTGAPQRAAQAVTALALHPDTTPYPLIRGLQELVEDLRSASLGMGDLGEQIEAGTAGETRAQAGEDISQQRLIMALAALRCAGWDPSRLRPVERMELVAACSQFLDAAGRELDHQLACIGSVRVLLGRVKA